MTTYYYYYYYLLRLLHYYYYYYSPNSLSLTVSTPSLNSLPLSLLLSQPWTRPRLQLCQGGVGAL